MIPTKYNNNIRCRDGAPQLAVVPYSVPQDRDQSRLTAIKGPSRMSDLRSHHTTSVQRAPLSSIAKTKEGYRTHPFQMPMLGKAIYLMILRQCLEYIMHLVKAVNERAAWEPNFDCHAWKENYHNVKLETIFDRYLSISCFRANAAWNSTKRLLKRPV
ncbi:hypothetical protein ABW19_dt0202751 [Dactylella cylindrospora]|nr:hypothetical protein ABW19_dt0202751 [Dactylella cylindrospora]